MVIFPSPAGGIIKPAAAGVQALTMNSPGSAWTPVLAGLRQLICRRRKNTKPKPTSYTLYRTGTKYRSGHGRIAAPCQHRPCEGHAPGVIGGGRHLESCALPR